MATYSVPNIFVAGTKASADEVNTNFSYITTILDGMSAARYPFCVNTGNRDSKENEDLFSYQDATVTTKIGGSYPDVMYTTGAGLPTTITESASITLSSTSYSSFIPTMTSNVVGDVTCTTNNEYSGTEAWKAFDKNQNTYWGTLSGVSTAQLMIGFGERHLARSYYIKVLTPANWVLEGSNDENGWTTLDTYSVAEASTVFRPLEVLGNYNVYRLTITNPDLSDPQIRLAEFDLYQKSESGTLKLPETQILYLGKSGIEAKSGKFFRQELQPVGNALYDAVIPTMSSNIVPDGYIITASSSTATNAPYLATDRRDDSYWEASDTLNEVWFQVQLPNPVIAKVCKITAATNGSALDKALVNGTLYGSNNGATWVPLYTVQNLTWNYSNESKYLYFTDNSTAYSYYRLVGTDSFASMAEFQLFSAAENGEYLLGEASRGDVWFKASEPYASYIYDSTGVWTNFDLVPAGEADMDSDGNIIAIRTYPYNQNGFNINASTLKEGAGNIVTYDSYVYHYGESGYAKLPNKMILQWGLAEGSQATLFPMVFPHKVFGVYATPISDGFIMSTIKKCNTAGFTLINGKGSSMVENIQNFWYAVGW